MKTASHMTSVQLHSQRILKGEVDSTSRGLKMKDCLAGHVATEGYLKRNNAQGEE